ncbi:uncharacterized protein [Onthophagus taurus]|uniref:uncharacterized protein n=1 Tax=Onthophagus taurus TaxID=166361 RepID=UPI0039BE9EE7
MKVLLTLLLASGIYCRNLRGENNQQELLKISDELRGDDSLVDERNGYSENSVFEENANKDLTEKLHQYYLLVEERINLNPDQKLSPLDKAVYLFVKTMKQRNKRQNKKMKYLTFCHFKICNIGGKRAARYVHMSKPAYEDSVPT